MDIAAIIKECRAKGMTTGQIIAHLRKVRSELHASIDGVLSTADEQQAGELTAEQIESIEAEESTIAKIDESIEALEREHTVRSRHAQRADQLRTTNRPPVPANHAAAVDEGNGGQGNSPTAHQARVNVRTPELTLADFVRAAVRPDMAGHDERIRMAMSAGNFSEGGFLVPENYVPQLIELLRPMTVVRQRATIAPLSNGTLTLPRLTSGASGEYLGESEDISTSTVKGGHRRWVEKKLASVVPLSNDLVANSSPSATDIINGDLARALAETEDSAFIRDDGQGNAPKGLRFWALAAQVFNATAGTDPALSAIDKDLGDAMTLLMEANLSLAAPAWLMAPRSWNYLSTKRDGNGNKAYPELENGMLKGWPVAVTTLIPKNLGGGGDESEIYFADFREWIIADDPTVRLESSQVAAYASGGSVIAAFSRDETVVRIIRKHDFGPRHEEAVAVIDAVRWGA